MIDKLKDISEVLEKESENIKDQLGKSTPNIFTVYKFVLKESEDDGNYELQQVAKNDSKVDLKGKNGIYIFYSENPITSFQNSFNDVKYGAKTNLNVEIEENSKKILYLGKSYDLSKRLQEHFSENDVLPYSLKCSHKNRKNIFQDVKLYVFVLEEEYNGYKEVILSTVETFLHEKCLPIIGSRRV